VSVLRGDPEIVFKYRDADFRRAAALDVRPKIAGKYRLKFKVQALPLNDHVRRLSDAVLA
jgi:hypothetical protein